MLIKDVGICLGRREYSETSQIATIFTREHGKIRGMAKGARRAKGKFGGGIELLSRGQLVFSQGRGGGLLTLTEWTVQENYLGLRRDVRQLYDFFCQVLTGLSSGKGWEEFLAFQMRLLGEVGLSPELSSCVCCGKGSGGRLAGYISFSEGGILCRGCARDVAEKQQIEPAGMEIVRKLAAGTTRNQANEPTYKQAQAGTAGLEDGQARQGQKLLSYWVRAALNREPKTAYLLR